MQHPGQGSASRAPCSIVTATSVVSGQHHSHHNGTSSSTVSTSTSSAIVLAPLGPFRGFLVILVVGTSTSARTLKSTKKGVLVLLVRQLVLVLKLLVLTAASDHTAAMVSTWVN